MSTAATASAFPAILSQDDEPGASGWRCISWRRASMGNISQKRALRNYRRRLNEPGMAGFEVLGLDTDRELIRSLAKRLAENDPEAARIRTTISRTISG